MKRRPRTVGFVACAPASLVTNFDPNEARDDHGEWTTGGGGGTAVAPPPGQLSSPAVPPKPERPFAYPPGYVPPKSLSPGVAVGVNPDAPQETRPQLTTDEAKAITDYTDVNVFRGLNEALKTGQPLQKVGGLGRMFGGKDQAGINAKMQAVFARTAVASAPMVVKRGVFSRNKDQLGQHMLANVGKVVTLPGYQSTSLVKTEPGEDAFGQAGGGFKGDVKFTIHAVHGIDMKPYSKFPAENEILLNHASEYKVGRVVHDQTDGSWSIELFQLPPKKGVTTNEYLETDGTGINLVTITYVGNIERADDGRRWGRGGHPPLEPHAARLDAGRGGITGNAARRPRVSPLKYDPSRTLTLRRGFCVRLRKKFAVLKGRVRLLLVTRDAFGLTVNYSPDEPRDELGRWSESGGLSETVWAGGGFTYKPLAHRSPTAGVVVSLPREMRYEKAVTEREFKAKGKYLVHEYLKRVRDDIKAGKLDRKHAHVGAWHDRATGRVVLDVNEVYKDKQEGINVGRKRSQDAVFDLGTFEEINLRDERGHRPTGNAGRADGGGIGRGTGGTGPTDGRRTVLNTEYQFHADSAKLDAFQKWLQDQYDDLLTGGDEERAWELYVDAGYQKGAGRGYDEVTKGGDGSADFRAGGRDGFLKVKLRAPETVDKVKLLAGRAFDEMENVTADMSTRMSRILADGLVQGLGSRAIAKDLDEAMDFEEGRAERIARTEIVRAHAEGQLDALEDLGVTQVGVQVEWSTAGDGRVCNECDDMDGKVFDVEDAHGLIPLHPDCRCAFLPANVGENP